MDQLTWGRFELRMAEDMGLQLVWFELWAMASLVRGHSGHGAMTGWHEDKGLWRSGQWIWAYAAAVRLIILGYGTQKT